jgi:hypothetical protein
MGSDCFGCAQAQLERDNVKKDELQDGQYSRLAQPALFNSCLKLSLLTLGAMPPPHRPSTTLLRHG